MKESIIFHVHLTVMSPAITLPTLIHWVYSVTTSKLAKSLLNKPHAIGTDSSVMLSPRHSPKGSL